jgi:hypothetical protein
MKKNALLILLIFGLAIAANAQQPIHKAAADKAPADYDPSKLTTYHGIMIRDVDKNIGNNVEIFGKVQTIKSRGDQIAVTIGAPFTNELFTFVLIGPMKASASKMEGRKLEVLGKIIMHNGKPEIEVRDFGHLNIHRM